MTQQHERLNHALETRCGELDMTWTDLADESRVSENTLRAIRRGRNGPSPRTKRRIEKAVHWRPGSIDAILAGGDPTVDSEHTPLPPDVNERLERLERMFAEALAEFEHIRDNLGHG